MNKADCGGVNIYNNPLVRGGVPLQKEVTASAVFSDCGTYRYELSRDWTDPPGTRVLWIMLNPSSASYDRDDPTIRSCQKYSRAWGYDGIVVANVFALRATSPDALVGHSDPVGPENDDVIKRLLSDPSIDFVIAAWGVHGAYSNRGGTVYQLITASGHCPYVLGLTKHGYPRHPLYVKDSTSPFPWV